MLNNIRGAIRILFKKSWVVILVMAIFASSAFVVSEYVLPKKYSASALVYVYNGREYEPEDAVSNSDVLASQELAQVVGVILRSDDILQEVVDTLKLSYTVDDLKNMTTAKTVDSTEALMITATSESAEEAMLLVNQIVDTGMISVPDISQGGQMNIINYASEPTVASYPTVGKNVLLATFIGLFLSLLAIYIFELINQNIRFDDDLTDEQKKKTLGKLSNKKTDLQSTVTRLMFTLKKRGGNVVVFTSHAAKNASASVCVALAKAAARCGKRVLIIETDPKKGYIDETFPVENNCGFSEAIEGVNVGSCVHDTDVHNLYYMPYGRRQLERLDSDTLKKPIVKSSELYDYVFISTSPLEQNADVCSYKELCAAAVLAVPQRKMHKDELAEAIKLLEENVCDNTLLMLCENNITTSHTTRSAPSFSRMESRQKAIAKTL